MRRAVRLRWVVLRTAWLLIGAAIGLATALVVFGLAELIQPGSGSARPLLVAGCVLPALLIGLLPGVRELEVTAARNLLGVDGDLVTPAHPRAEHRWRTIVLVTFHLATGLLAGMLLLAMVPGFLRLGLDLAVGRTQDYRVFAIRVPPVSVPVALLLGVGGALTALVAVWALGRLTVVVTSRLLGATAQDRLEVALERLGAESEHTRLARDLHDGIGHALTIISVQAAGARKGHPDDPERLSESLSTIEATARQALTELDDMLGLLRDRDPSGLPAPDLEQLPALLATYRSAGMDLSADLDPLGTVPLLVSTMAYRIVAEALTNAQRHGDSGPVQLTLQRRPGLLSIDSRNGLPSDAPNGRAAGHGLDGIAERVALFGGSVESGAQHDRWELHAEIPTGTTGG